MIVVSSVFQHDETIATEFNQNMVFSRFRDAGLTTSAGESNVNGGSDDFNVTLGNNDVAVKYAEGSDFQPEPGSILIDSSVNSLIERDALVNLKNSVGLPISNILAPNIDVAGILRADHPDFAPPGGIGASIFKDRGSSELADFVGPIAIAEAPRDNDADGIDADPAISAIDLKSGTYEEFRIQLRDTGDASDPFAGIGIDDSTVVVPAIPGVRPSGANVSLFENTKLLTEGIDYTFNYDETKNIITLTPLAGIWRNDRAYRISLNNQDQTVLIASDPADIRDGDQFSISDSTGGTVVFEFETGYQLLLPEPITLIVPSQGTNAGGVRDGDIFQISDGVNPAIVFEFNSDTATLPGTTEVPLTSDPTPLDPEQLKTFLHQIASDTQAVILAQVDAGRLDVDVRVVDNRIILGANRGATATTSGSGLQQLARTAALRVPSAGSDPVNGVADGDTFVINNGSTSTLFQFTDGTTTPGNNAIAVDITSNVPLTANEVAIAIFQSVSTSGLGIDPQIIGTTVYLNLPESGSVTVGGGRLGVVGVARPPADGDTLTITPTDGSAPVNFEIDRIDDPNLGGIVTGSNVAVGVQRGTTAAEFAEAIRLAILSETTSPNSIAGLNPNGIQTDGGLLVIGGDPGLGLTVTGTSLDVVGVPDVTGASTIQVFGPLLLNMPTVGGGAIQSGEVLILKDLFDNDVLFEFVSNQGGVQALDGGFNPDQSQRPLSIVVPFNTFDTDAQIAATLQGIINAQNIGLTASAAGVGQVSLGRIDQSRVSTSGDPANGVPGINQITVQRGIVSDGEVLEIRQGTNVVRFEFEEATSGGGVTAGNVPVAFQAGSTVADVANSLAAAINNNAVNLRFTSPAVATANGEVILNDVPGTVVDISNASTLAIVGVPGGARRVTISPAFSSTEVKNAILSAINGINDPNATEFTSLVAQDRGGNTLFVRNATTLTGTGITTYFLPAIKDLSGNPLEANREDLTTQFTILMPNSALDFGDAPDPVNNVDGRYPTLLANNGPRHVLDGSLTLGRSIDVDLDGRPVPLADGDDTVVSISSTGLSFTTSQIGGTANIQINTAAVLNGDGDTITIDTGANRATLELDLDGIFDEDNFAIRPASPITTASIADAINAAILESPVRPAGTARVGVDAVTNVVVSGSTFTASIAGDVADVLIDASNASDGDTITIITGGYRETLELDFNGVTAPDNIAVSPASAVSNASIGAALTKAIASSQLSQAKISVDGTRLAGSDSIQVNADDEDGVVLTSASNPNGVLNKNSATPISVTVFGSGVVDAWIDFNADGDWDDPGEKIIDRSNPDATFVDPDRNGVTKTFLITVPATTPVPPTALTTYARFRVSRDGGLTPTGLSLSGEVEDYALSILPGGPPTLSDAQAHRTFDVDEGGTLSALDANGTLTPSSLNDNGLLEGVVDNEGDQVAIFADDVGTFTLFAGTTRAGDLRVFSNGTFTFVANGDFNGDTDGDGDVDSDDVGQLEFTVRVTDVHPLAPGSQSVNNRAITATINVQPVNDPPIANTNNVAVIGSTNEDTALTLDASSLITPFYVAGPTNELGQPLVIQSVRSVANGNGQSEQNGSVEILNGGTTIRYTPRLDYFGADSFTYVVADQPGTGQLSQASSVQGTVSINVLPINDRPIAREDRFMIDEGEPLSIGINNTTGLSALLTNDSPGPNNESNQSISLTATQTGSFQNGTVQFNPATGIITYTPRAFFSGTDSFTYTVTDTGTPAETSTGLVTITVGGTNDNPNFIGINGDPLVQDFTGTNAFLESKETPQQFSYDLTTWFSDPESDDLMFTASSGNPSLVRAVQQEGTLTLTLASFAFGTTNLEITASDGNGGERTVNIPITVTATPDPPQVIGQSEPYNGLEDQNIVIDLRTVFFDPDAEPLTYRLVALGNFQNPTQAQLAAHPLIQSIEPRNSSNEITGRNLIISPKPNQSGSTDIIISAEDDDRTVIYAFTVNFAAVDDAPVAISDSYNVPIRSVLQISDPAKGLLKTGTQFADFDADGDEIYVDLNSITDPSFGTVSVAEDGTFTYTNDKDESAVGLVDTFTYRIRDRRTGAQSAPVVVSLTLNQSKFQNPIQGLESDVNADGLISPIDILRVINFLAAAGGDVAVNDPTPSVQALLTGPPDYLDVTGEGMITPNDILSVINTLAEQNRPGQGEMGQGEMISLGQQVGQDVSFAVTTAFASPQNAHFPISNRERAEEDSLLANDDSARDALLTGGIVLDDTRLDAGDWIDNDAQNDPVKNDRAVDEALEDMWSDLSLNSLLGGN
ncbi:MAG: Ig-like domain-containing protein [Pirellulaceae bacterium]